MRQIALRRAAAFVALWVCHVLQAGYEDPQGRFSFEPPKGWRPESLEGKSKIAVFTEPEDRAAIMVMALPVRESTILKDVPLEYEKILEKDEGVPLRLSKETSLEIAGNPALQREYAMREEDESASMVAVFTMRGSLSIMIALAAPDGDFASFQEAFRKSLQSLRFPAQATPVPPADMEAKLKALEAARQAGILTEEEYRRKVAELAGSGAAPEGASSPRPAGTVHLKQFVCMDKLAQMEALRLLLPVDWRFEGGVQWLLDNPMMPAFAQFRVTSPSGTEEFEVFPSLPMFHTRNPLLVTGPRYFGAEVHPVLGAREAMQQIVVPRLRGRANPRLLEIAPVPQLAEIVKAEAQDAQAAKARIEYIRNGIPMEEEMYCVVEVFPQPLVPLNTVWFIDCIFSFKAKKGELANAAPLLQTIAFSLRLSPQWFNAFVQVKEYLCQAQIRQIRHIGELGSIIARTGSQMRQENLDLFYRRQQANDRLVDNFCRNIRGVEKYHDPYKGHDVELPSGYQNVWVNNLGEYILSESPSFNPGIGSNLSWRQIQAVQ